MADHRRKRLLLHLSRKMEAIDLINKGKPLVQIAGTYGVGLSTVSNWKKKQYEIRRYCSRLHMSQARNVLDERYTMKKPNDNTLDGALFIWYEEALDRGEYITGKTLQQKAKEINLKLTGVDNFSGSIGWLTRWKKRHGIIGKFAKKPDERMLLPLPAVEDGEDPLKLDVDEDRGKRGTGIRDITGDIPSPSREKLKYKSSESKEVPFLTNRKRPSSSPEIKNVEEIINSIPKYMSPNSPKVLCRDGDKDKSPEQVYPSEDFILPHSVLDCKEETDTDSSLNADGTFAQNGQRISFNDLTLVIEDADDSRQPAQPMTTLARSAGTAASEVYEISDNSDEEDVITVEEEDSYTDDSDAFVISEDVEDGGGNEEIEVEEEKKGSFLIHQIPYFKQVEDSSSR